MTDDSVSGTAGAGPGRPGSGTAGRDRDALKARLSELLDEAAPWGPRPALVLVDLDGFRTFNDRYGRRLADEALETTWSRLTDGLAGGEPYRVVGDQFAVVVERATEAEALDWGEAALTMVAAPMAVRDAEISLSACCAVVMLGRQRRVDGLLRDADVTMFRAKTEGPGHVALFNPELDEWVSSRKGDIDHLAAEVDRLRYENRVLAEAMLIDPRTGLPNSAAFDADHVQVHARRRRNEEPYSLLLIDIDWFHRYKEHFGAAAANETLRLVAITMRDAVRLGDRAYRYQEDEFAVLLPGTVLKDAIAAGERLRGRIEKLGLEHPGTDTGIVTVTVAAVEAGFRHGDAKDVLVEADQVLLESRASSSNMVVWPR